MKYFISERELSDLQKSYLYKDLPLAFIIYRELLRKNILRNLRPDYFYNFFARYLEWGCEIMFSDHSHLVIDFTKGKCYVFHAERRLYKEFDF